MAYGAANGRTAMAVPTAAERRGNVDRPKQDEPLWAMWDTFGTASGARLRGLTERSARSVPLVLGHRPVQAHLVTVAIWQWNAGSGRGICIGPHSVDQVGGQLLLFETCAAVTRPVTQRPKGRSCPVHLIQQLDEMELAVWDWARRHARLPPACCQAAPGAHPVSSRLLGR